LHRSRRSVGSFPALLTPELLAAWSASFRLFLLLGALLATRGRGLDLLLLLVGCFAPETFLLDLLDGQEIDGGSREVAGATRQEGDLFILNIKREPTATQGSNLDDVSRPPSQLTAAVTEHHEFVVKFDNDLEFGRGFTIQLDASVKLYVSYVAVGL
jgi:hypothetical protein